MNRAEKKKFIRDLCNAVRDRILEDCHKMPDEWDGHELRQLIMERFSHEATLGDLGQRSRRLREYRNTCYTQCL